MIPELKDLLSVEKAKDGRTIESRLRMCELQLHILALTFGFNMSTLTLDSTKIMERVNAERLLQPSMGEDMAE